MIRRLSAGLVLACCACAGEAGQTGAASAFRPPAAEAPAPAAEAYLVWSASPESPGETAWIDGEGRMVARRPGIVAAGSGGLWAWTVGKETVRGVDCECLRNAADVENARCPIEGEVATVHLVDLLGGRRVAVLAAKPSDDIASPEQGPSALSGVGPYLFVESGIGTYACGAHGSNSVEARVYDLSRGAARVELLDSAEVAAVMAREGVEGTARLKADFADWEWEETTERRVDLTEVEAKWTPAGTLKVAYQLTTGACYPCSDGHSSSYTRSAIVPAAAVPARLAEWTRAPEAVRRYWQTAPPGERAGWSRVDAADPEAALARFRRP